MATTIIVVTCAIGFASFLYLEDIAYLARASVSKLGYSCTAKDQVLKADAGVSSATAGNHALYIYILFIIFFLTSIVHDHE